MESVGVDCPVAFLVFNRPRETSVVFDHIRRARPTTLLIVADGPRPSSSSDVENCSLVRRIIEEGIDWPCKVKTRYSDLNLGCGLGVSGGLDWVFSIVDQAIILEDDCVPAQSFFPYCRDLLSRYSNDTRVMQICGTNVSPESTSQEYSYYFSKYGPIWGWASWKRAWEYYDVKMRSYMAVGGEHILDDVWEYPGEGEYREALYRRILSGELDTWDLQWGYAKYINSGLSIIPSTNLISNIGYGGTSTHTGDSNDPMANKMITELTFPLRHYPYVVRNKKVDRAFHEIMTPEQFKNLDSKSE